MRFQAIQVAKSRDVQKFYWLRLESVDKQKNKNQDVQKKLN